MKDDDRVLDAIKRFGPLSAYGFSIILKFPEKRGVHSAISRLRKKGQRIWNDTDRQAFWWADDIEPDASPQKRWKRTWADNFGITATNGLERARMFLDAASKCQHSSESGLAHSWHTKGALQSKLIFADLAMCGKV